MIGINGQIINILNSNFTNNSAILSNSGSLDIYFISNNSSDVIVIPSNITIFGNKFSENKAMLSGGAVSLIADMTRSDNCTIRNNNFANNNASL